MTPEQFRVWRDLMGWTRSMAADQLGLSYSAVENYERGTRRDDGTVVVIPHYVELACAALALNIKSYDGSDRLVFDLKRIARD